MQTAVAEQIPDDLEVTYVPDHDGRLMESDVHAGRPMRPEHRDRGFALMEAWLVGDLAWVN